MFAPFIPIELRRERGQAARPSPSIAMMTSHQAALAIYLMSAHWYLSISPTYFQWLFCHRFTPFASFILIESGRECNQSAAANRSRSLRPPLQFICRRHISTLVYCWLIFQCLLLHKTDATTPFFSLKQGMIANSVAGHETPSQLLCLSLRPAVSTLVY